MFYSISVLTAIFQVNLEL